jgi:hypothetical protein
MTIDQMADQYAGETSFSSGRCGVVISYDDTVRARLKVERQLAYEERVTRRVGGTPETVAKASVTKHASEMLMDRGVIDGGQFASLKAIEAGFRLITEAVTPKLSSLTRSDPGERGEGHWERLCVLRYREWAADLVAAHKLPCQRVCLHVAVDGLGISAVADRMNRHHGTIRVWLIDGLDAYHAVKRRVR